MLELTTKDVITTRIFRPAIKIAPVKIRPITQTDIEQIGPSFFDLEKRPQKVDIGRYLCVGVNNERWTCSDKSMEARLPISEPDDKGFRLYVQRKPTPVLVTLVDEPFSLTIGNDHWQSESGAITWNGLSGDLMIMRVIEKNIFFQTYQFLTDQQ